MSDILEHGGQRKRRLSEERPRLLRSDRLVANLDQDFGIFYRVGQGGETSPEGQSVPVRLAELVLIVGGGLGTE